jgi:predicted RNase H-like HicB family nuclease
MNNELMEKAAKLAARNYTLSLFNDETVGEKTIYLAKSSELYGCMAQGETLEEAIKNLEEARVDYIYSLLEDGLDVPEPAPKAVMTVDTAFGYEAEANLVATVNFKEKSITHSKLLYKASMRT